MTIIRCNYPNGGASCTELLAEPAKVIADPDLWPKHLYCHHVARESTRQWAERQAKRAYGNEIPEAVRAWVESWPLRVMRADTMFSHLSHADVPEHLLPLQGWPRDWFFGEMPHAALIVEAEFRNPSVTVTAFGLKGSTVPPAPILFTTSGAPNAEAYRFQERLAKWWQGGNQTGRPHGGMTVHEARAAFRAFVLASNGTPPNQLQLAIELGCSERQLRKVVGPWRAFVENGLADMERIREQFRTIEAGT